LCGDQHVHKEFDHSHSYDRMKGKKMVRTTCICNYPVNMHPYCEHRELHIKFKCTYHW